MLSVYLVNELLLNVVATAANTLLRALGGPDHVPNCNDDFIWY